MIIWGRQNKNTFSFVFMARAKAKIRRAPFRLSFSVCDTFSFVLSDYYAVKIR